MAVNTTDRTVDAGTILVIGGARSGKSGFALKLCAPLSGSKFYIATALALDDEMGERIKRHKEGRDQEWTTIEEPVDIAGRLGEIEPGAVIVVDCLTLWLSNLIHKGLNDGEILEEAKGLAGVFTNSGSTVVTVSNEVGLGGVPANPLARRFADLSGLMNQTMARAADEVFFMAAGISMKLK